MDPIFIPATLIAAFFAYSVGYWTGLNAGKKYGYRDITDYINKEWPDEKTAYDKGVRDGQRHREDNEPA